MPQDTTEKILYGIFGILVCLGLFLLYKFYTLDAGEQGDIAPIAMGRLIKQAIPKSKPVPMDRGDRAKSFTDLKPQPLPKLNLQKKADIQSDISKRRFAKQTFLNVNLPGHMKYIEVDLEDGVKSIFGFNAHTKEGLTAAARRGPLTMDQVKQFLKEDQDAVPNLNGKKLSNISEVQKMPGASRKKGVKSVEVISADTNDGEKVHVALVNREDQKGSYVFIYSGPKGMMENNDGYLDRIFNDMEVVKPPPPQK